MSKTRLWISACRRPHVRLLCRKRGFGSVRVDGHMCDYYVENEALDKGVWTATCATTMSKTRLWIKACRRPHVRLLCRKRGFGSVRVNGHMCDYYVENEALDQCVWTATCATTMSKTRLWIKACGRPHVRQLCRKRGFG